MSKPLLCNVLLCLPFVLLGAVPVSAQPPQTRPDAGQRPGEENPRDSQIQQDDRDRPGDGERRGRGDRPAAADARVAPDQSDWPQLRQPGRRPPEGQGADIQGADGPRAQGRSADALREEYREPRAEIRIAPGVAPPSRDWYLGIYPERAPKGVRVARVVPGTPAQRFGLERDDYILDVGGYVVGEYQGRYYPLSMAMDYGVGPDGWAELLVWNHRNYQEQLLWVRLRRR
ncbi:hypothetical protein [Roseimaritima sediminicola]|uniref:hypothetical protein n=1 Tax=Roseimaritima sediminicola TaxID=2662066 RepID=UPI0012983E42|nr:hypothetical protein [Roseimaritima sediminicola]